MAIAFIGLGSNLGDRSDYLSRAVEQLKKIPKISVMTVSFWHETTPIGGPPQGAFLNGVVKIETSLTPEALLTQLQSIEQVLGRPKQREPWGPRVIDLDLLTYDDLIMDTPALTIPHPQMHKRSFVLTPLAEIAPEWQHPKLKRTAQELLAEMPTCEL